MIAAACWFGLFLVMAVKTTFLPPAWQDRLPSLPFVHRSIGFLMFARLHELVPFARFRPANETQLRSVQELVDTRTAGFHQSRLALNLMKAARPYLESLCRRRPDLQGAHLELTWRNLEREDRDRRELFRCWNGSLSTIDQS